MTPARRVDILTLVVLAGFVLAVGLAYWQGYYLAKPYPYDTFLFNPGDKFAADAPGVGVHFFGDWYGTWRQTRAGSPYVSAGLPYPSNYFPFTHLMFKPLSWFGYAASTVLLLGVSWLLLLWAVWRSTPIEDRVRRAIAVLVIGVLSYPVLFAIDRGNVELVIFLLLWAALLLVERTRYVAAAVPLALAASMKLVPLLLAAVFIPLRQWKALALSVGLTAVLSGLALLTFDGSLGDNVDGLRQGLDNFSETTEGGAHGLQHNSTIRGLFEVLEQEGWSWLGWAADGHRPIAILVGLVFTGAAILLPLALWERVTLLVVTFILVPPVSYDYRLIHVLLPVLLLMRFARPVPLAAVLLLGFVLIPKGLPILFADVTIGTVLNPLALLALGALVAVTGLRRRQAGEVVPA